MCVRKVFNISHDWLKPAPFIFIFNLSSRAPQEVGRYASPTAGSAQNVLPAILSSDRLTQLWVCPSKNVIYIKHSPYLFYSAQLPPFW